MKKSVYSVVILLLFLSFSASAQISRLYVGKYAKEGEKGLHIIDVDLSKGVFTTVSESDAGTNPSYFCISKKRSLIYAVNEVGRVKDVRAGAVTTLRFDAVSGKTEKVNDIAVPNGGPCYISLTADERFLLVANYGGGSVAVVRLDAEGIPVEVSDTIIYEAEEGARSRGHMIAPGPGGKMIYVTDLGLDRVAIYQLDPVSGKLKLINNGYAKLAKGAGPRHFAFGKDGSKMYVINELNSTMTVFNVANTGELTEVQTLSTLPEGFTGKNYCADIHVSKNGKYVYGSNRGHNSIVTFKIGSDGKVTPSGYTPCGGDWPRNFVLDPSGKYLLSGNQNSGNISLFTLDKKTGLPLAPSKDFKIASPSCLKFIE
jgi:6-phosphogluconolactonase